jgi:hypothetical protein
MGHESPIELWSPNLTTFCFVGFGTDRLRRQEAMKTAGRENPNHRSTVLREHMARVNQNRSRSLKWAEKQENLQPKEMCFFLTSTFIEQIRSCRRRRLIHCWLFTKSNEPDSIPQPQSFNLRITLTRKLRSSHTNGLNHCCSAVIFIIRALIGP